MPGVFRFLGVAMISLTTIAGCASAPDDSEGATSGSSEDALTSAGGATLVHYLGSSSFLRQCAGNTLGCGRAVSSVSDATPYFSAPRTWSRSTCNEFFTFRANGRCVEAQRLEVSDTHNFIEGNPGLFAGLGVHHSDGANCSGSGQTTATVTPGRHCNGAPATSTASDSPPADADAGSCFSPTLGKTMPPKTCVQSRGNDIWYQCSDGVWLRGVTGNTGPLGACSSTHPL